MKVVRFEEKLNCPIVICLGYFGCMHTGHVKLLQVAKSRAEQTFAKVALFTFSNNHLAVMGRQDKVVYTFDERLSIYESLGVDYVVAAEFDEKFRQKSGREFVDALCGYDLRGVVCGFDYTCGSDRADCNALRRQLAGICSVDVVEPVCRNGQKISTTLVRSYLKENNVEQANELLSEDFFVEGTVVCGRHLGNRLGFPTANISVDGEKFLPLGVYGATTVVNGKQYRVIVNIGQKPTFDLNCVNVEAHLLDFDGDLYGKKIKLSIRKFLRQTQRFENARALVTQLQKDKEAVLND